MKLELRSAQHDSDSIEGKCHYGKRNFLAGLTLIGSTISSAAPLYEMCFAINLNNMAM